MWFTGVTSVSAALALPSDEEDKEMLSCKLRGKMFGVLKPVVLCELKSCVVTTLYEALLYAVWGKTQCFHAIVQDSAHYTPQQQRVFLIDAGKVLTLNVHSDSRWFASVLPPRLIASYH